MREGISRIGFRRSPSRSAGEGEGEGIRIHLPEDSSLRMEDDSRGERILCAGGILWVTQEEDPADHILQSGEDFVVDRSGLVIIYALTDACAGFEAGK